MKREMTLKSQVLVVFVLFLSFNVYAQTPIFDLKSSSLETVLVKVPVENLQQFQQCMLNDPSISDVIVIPIEGDDTHVVCAVSAYMYSKGQKAGDTATKSSWIDKAVSAVKSFFKSLW